MTILNKEVRIKDVLSLFASGYMIINVILFHYSFLNTERTLISSKLHVDTWAILNAIVLWICIAYTIFYILTEVKGDAGEAD